MGRTIEISGIAMVYLFYAVSLAVVPVATYFVVSPLDGLPGVVVTGLLAALVLVAGADLWYWKRGETSEHLATAARRNLPYDITYDPTADPGQGAKRHWVKAVRRLPDGDDEEDR